MIKDFVPYFAFIGDNIYTNFTRGLVSEALLITGTKTKKSPCVMVSVLDCKIVVSESDF